MCGTCWRLVRGCALSIAVGWAVAPLAAAAPPALRMRPAVLLHLAVLGPPAGSMLARSDVELSRGEPASADLDVRWLGARARVSLRLTLDADSAERTLVTIRSELRAGDRILRAPHAVVIAEGTSRLLELDRSGDSVLVLAVSGERTMRPAVAAPSAGPPLRFEVDIERAEGDRFVPLETNQMNTLLGEPVRYSFRRGEGASAESVDLTLTPLAIDGDVAQVEISVEGTLPEGEHALQVGKSQTAVLTRGASTSIVAVAGTPPSGYRFVIRSVW